MITWPSVETDGEPQVTNDLLLAADTGLFSILILLDLCSNFYTVDLTVLISCLKNYVGISALNWFISYLSIRVFLLLVFKALNSHAPAYICEHPMSLMAV